MQSVEFVIRKAVQGDASGILECLRSAFEPFRAEYTAEAFEDTILTPDSLAQRFSALQMQIYVAEATDCRIVGTIACSVKNAGEGHLRGMAVDPAWQGSDVASALLATAEASLAARGCSRVILGTTQCCTEPNVSTKETGIASRAQ